MNTYLLIAGILCLLLGLVHSILGEILIFHKKRKPGYLVPTKKSVDLKERHLRIIWATWHLASVFGACIGVVLLQLSCSDLEMSADMELIINTISISMFISSLLVLIATKGKHPGWLVLLIIAVLLQLA